MGNASTLVGSTKGQEPMPRPPNEPDDKAWSGRVARRLKALRVAAKLDVESAAAAISKAGYEITDRGLYKWEQGRTMPHLEALPAIARAYRIAVRSILPRE
jgi:DNA-binding XRE family transcriptional regulator